MSTDAPDFLVYGSPVSPFVRKVLAFAIEKGAAFDIEPVNIMDPPADFAVISPMKRIPVLRDRSVGEEGAKGTIADSSAICAYIEKKHPNPALYPSAPFPYGHALFIEEYADTMLAPTAGLGIFRPIFFNVMGGNQPDSEKARLTWAQEMPPVLDFLESQLGDADWFAPATVSIADIAVACVFMQIELVAHAPLDNWPALKAHIERMRTRPSIAEPLNQAEGFVRKVLPEVIDLT